MTIAAMIASAAKAPRWLAIGVLLVVPGCSGAFSGPPPPTQAEMLCQKWGYAPHDPVCLNTFRWTGGQ